MLTNVPAAINHSTRQVVLRHPNGMPCIVWRKSVTRTETDPNSGAESTMGGSPTLGGMGVLKSEDESEFEYVELGAGKMLFSGPYEQQDMVERDNSLVQATMQLAVVESLAEPGASGYFVSDVGDLVLLDVGLSVFLAYTVEAVTGNVNIPPYTRKLVLNPRDDLHALEPFIPG